jgi:Fe-S cluster assembly protein SufD
MSVEVKLRFDRDMITQYSKQAGEPDWMLKLRLQGFDSYDNLPLPKLEKTKIDKWNLDGFLPFKQHEQITDPQHLPEEVKNLLAGKPGEQKAILVQQDASVIYTHLPEELKNKGVVFLSLQEALGSHGDLVQKHFMSKDSKVDSHKLAALHTAAWSGGAFLYVPKNVEVDLPIQSVFLSSVEGSGLFPHVIIITESNSTVSYTDSFINTTDEEVVQNGIVEIHVGASSKVKFTSTRTFSQNVTDYIFRHAVVERDGRMEWVLGEMNLGDSVTENSTQLLGQGSSTDSKLITIGTGTQKENVVSKVVHKGKNTDSQVLIKGVVKDEATTILNGITFIEKGATKANGEQAESLLMLSPKARGDANPILLIDEDDVKAGHAASAGQINPMQIFYLMSRGISKNEAIKLIINGFSAPVSSAVELDSVREHLERAMERKVAQWT